MSKSNWTLRHPRTLDEAFGYGTPRRFADTRRSDRVITIISAIGVAALIVLPLLGWMR